jgi:hypothetical protein
VYVKRVKAFGYCCGVEWSSQGWKYEINTCNDNISVWGSELIGTGNLRSPLALAQPSLPQEKPVFRLGELVEFRFHGDGPPIRIVQGIQMINDSGSTASSGCLLLYRKEVTRFLPLRIPSHG